MLQMIVNPSAAPQPISWNYEELKAELTANLARYENRVYTEAEINTAKKEKAALNQLRTLLNDERIRREKEYMAPFATFKAQVKDLCDIIDAASKNIGEQLDAMEEKRIEEKRGLIETEYFVCVEAIKPSVPDIEDWLELDAILDPRWYNKTFTMPKVREAIEERLRGIANDITALKSMGDFEGIECYKEVLDLSEAIKQSKAIRDMKAKAAEAKTKEQPKVSEDAKWVNFKALLTKTQAVALAQFCKENGIRIEPIKEATT